MNKSIILMIVLVTLVLLFVAARGTITSNTVDVKNILNIDTENDIADTKMETKQVKLQTTEGDIVIELREDMPITAGNFQKLTEEGFYDGVIFHRVIDGFMIQGGDPTGTGAGGPGYEIKDEFEGVQKNSRGTISMANAGPNTGGSQFFINLVDNNFLDGKHPVFGSVVEGMDVVDKIAKVQTNTSDKPNKEVKIIKAEVL